MNALLATAILALLSPHKATVTVNVNAKDGDIITGERTFRVTVDSANAVTGVEFYVAGDLRDKDTSTPYEFPFDSLAESEGDIRLRFKAYTTEGESGEKSITVHIDNQLGKGIDFHLQNGIDALQNGKYDDAITSARIALRIDPKSNPARLILARSYFAKSTFDKAQKYAEDAVGDDPNNAAASDLLSAIKLKQAFTTTAHEGDRKEALATIADAMKSAVETRRKTVDAALDRLGTPTDATVLPAADAALAAQRYSLAINELTPAWMKDNRRTEVANRLAFALMRLGRYHEALQILVDLKKNGQPDTYTSAEMAVVYAELGDAGASDAALKDALVSNPDDPAVLSAQAYVALKFVRHRIGDKVTLLLNYDDVRGRDANARVESGRVLANALDQLDKNTTGRPEVSFFECALNNKLEEFGRAERYFEQTLLADPLLVDAYVEQANRSIGETYNGKPSPDELDQRMSTAKVYFEAALAARPDSPQALSGLALIAVLEKKYDEAVRWGEAAEKAAPSYAAGAVILGNAYTLGAGAKRTEADAIRAQNKTAAAGSNSDRAANETKARQLETTAGDYARRARDVATLAGRLDPRLDGYDLTKPLASFRYFYTGGRIPLLPLPH